MPRDTLFASPHLGPMHTSVTPPDRMWAHSEQTLGGKKPFCVQAAAPSPPAPLGWEPGLRGCPSALPCGLSPPPQPGASLPWPGWHGSAQPLAGSPQSLSLMLSWRAGPSGTALSWILLAAMFSSKRCCQTTVSGAMSPRSRRAPATLVLGVGWGENGRVGEGDPRAEGV